MFQWNANLYNHFNKERLQPSIDLVNKLPKGEYKRIIDIGCGTGMSTWALRNKFLKSSIVRVDLSHEMLEKAQELKMDVEWIQRDCSKTLVDLGHTSKDYNLIDKRHLWRLLKHYYLLSIQCK